MTTTEIFSSLNFVGAFLYTILIAIVALFYWYEGHKKGIRETLGVFHEHEPEALKRLQNKLKEMMGVPNS